MERQIIHELKKPGSNFEQGQLEFMLELYPQMVPMVLEQLREEKGRELGFMKLDFYFGANELVNANFLCARLRSFKYIVEPLTDLAVSGQFGIRGVSTGVEMDNKTVIDWCTKMCVLGYEYGCNFEGWGATE